MKKYILFLALSFTTIVAMAQEKYIVVQVNGNILKADSSKIIPGTKILLQDKIIFPSSGGQIILANPQKGRLLVRPEKINKKGNYFVVLLSDYMEMHKEWKEMSSRGESVNDKK